MSIRKMNCIPVNAPSYEVMQLKGSQGSIEEAWEFAGTDVSQMHPLEILAYCNNCIHAGYLPLKMGDKVTNVYFGDYVLKDSKGNFTWVPAASFDLWYKII